MIDLILVIIFFASLIGIIGIILSKFPQLATINIDIIPSEQQRVIRHKIITNRLQGKFSQNRTRVLKTVRPFWLNFTSLFWKLYGTILEKERQLQHLAMTPEEKKNAKTKIEDLLEKAKIAAQDHLFMRAERLYINIISLDPKNLDAYDGLSQMYLQQKDYKKANETLKYVINLARKKRQALVKKDKDVSALDIKLVQYYLELGKLHQYQGDNESAMEQVQKAVHIDENNPKALDQLLEISIILKDNDVAKETIEKIEEVNPENQKISEWKKRIKELDEKIII